MRTRGGIPPASIIRLRFSSRPAILQIVAAALACRSGEAFCINEMRGGMAPAVATASCASSSFTAKLCNAPERDTDKQQARGWVSHSHVCKSVSHSHVCNVSHGTCATLLPTHTPHTMHTKHTHADESNGIRTGRNAQKTKTSKRLPCNSLRTQKNNSSPKNKIMKRANVKRWRAAVRRVTRRTTCHTYCDLQYT